MSLAEYLNSSYEQLVSYCAQQRNMSNSEQHRINKMIVTCQLDLLNLLDKELNALEKVAVFTAREYWLNEAVELTPIMQLLMQKLSDGLVYKAPRIKDKRRSIICLLWTEESGHFQNLLEMFEAFLEVFVALNFPQVLVKTVVERCFGGIVRERMPAAMEFKGFS